MAVVDSLSHFLVAVLVTLEFIISFKEVDAQPTVLGTSWVDRGMDTTLRCTPTNSPVRSLEWRYSSFDATDYTESDIIVEFVKSPSESIAIRDPTHYSFNEVDPSYPLTISGVTLADEARYWCVVLTDRVRDGSFDVHIRVPPSTIAITYNGTSYSNGASFPVAAGHGHQFTCTTPSVNPAVNFSWTLPASITTDQPFGSQTDISSSDDSRLVDSSNTITVSIAESPTTAKLTCSATNRQDGMTGSDLDMTVTLQITVHPKAVKLSDSDGVKTEGTAVDVYEGTPHMFTCLVQDSRPVATIQWLVDGVMPSSGVGTPTSTESNELSNTTGTWSFTPTRTNHRQVVKCVASATEWKQTFPSAAITLDVNGPPDTPRVTGSTSMTENQVSILTCRADQGYPGDWGLTWANGGTPVSGPTTSSSDSGDRYMFTSVWSFTPTRADNGKTITCTASRDSWTTSPVGSYGPIDVQFCARTVNVTTCPFVTAGNTATLRCVAESSNPATTLTWSKDSVNLTTPTDQPNTAGDYGGRVTSVAYTTGKLTKNNNGDVYECCGTNTAISSCYADLCSTCTLDVKYAPDFTSLSQSPDNPVIEGNEVNLMCTVDANPLPVDIVWVKQGSSDALSSSLNVTSTLTLSNIRREQAGNYTCRANNGVPTNNPNNDVISSPVTVIVYYETNITSKNIDVIGVKNGQDAELPCTAKGNPTPYITWYSPNNTQIISGMDSAKFTVEIETNSGDNVCGFEVTSTLTITKVDSRVDYGAYTCISSNGIGENDSLTVNLTGTRMPNPPTNVRITDETSESLTVKWMEGHNGGENQSFQVGHVKLPVSVNEEILSQNISATNAEENEYTVTDLKSYTQYEIRVYAQNTVGKNSEYGKTTGRTLPPTIDGTGIVIEFNTDSNTVEIKGLEMEKACIQLEVKEVGNGAWQECGQCIQSNQVVSLSAWCQSQKRRRRATGDIDEVRASLCIDGMCGEASPVKKVKDPTSSPVTPDNTGIIVGGVVGGVVLLAIIAGLATYLVRTSPDKHSRSRKDSCGSIELQSPVVNQEENNGVANEGLQNSDTYAMVEKKPSEKAERKKPPERPEKPQNLPDVTYGVVNKEKKAPAPPPDDYAALAPKKGKPKKYVPPSRDAEESAYEVVNINNGDGPKTQSDGDPTETYANVGEQQDASGRVVNEDGLIYAEVGHTKTHPADKPPIQTEESTEYASLDFSRMKTAESS